MTANNHASVAWQNLLRQTLASGSLQTPRDQPTKEHLLQTLTCPMASAVVHVPARKLNYKFMLAEALWILSGSDALADIAEYNSRMADYSDDGLTLAGAYGPRVVSQLPYVIRTLVHDPASRQAVLTTWNRTPEPSKDIPCTVSMQALIRDNQLHLLVTMRSSDIWLGIPYDLFSFSMIGLEIIRRINVMAWEMNLNRLPVEPGMVAITAGSSHIYLRDCGIKMDAALDPTVELPLVKPAPAEFWELGTPMTERLKQALKYRTSRWWVL
ncbi:MAG: thymidylate synthase [Gallionella sp.]|nr:thymidylate synthase [Gallionella sp.]MDD4958437.1 thymidylate synthase [Gallionella sp.]